jgi:hypothetical protein
MRIYSDLLKTGVPMNEIDNMDFPGYIRVIAYASGTKVKDAFIDDVLP